MKIQVVVLDDDDETELGRFDTLYEAEAAMDAIDAQRWEMETA